MIEFQHVNKRFGRKRPLALDNVSFRVARGEIFGLLGHNGAGKSTALGILLGLVHPDDGHAQIDGLSIQKSRVKALRGVGAIFESPRFYEYLTGRANLHVLTTYSGFRDEPLLEETVDWVGLTGVIDRPVGTYSHGMRQRLALAQALLPRPKLLLLDEPTNGLDPEGIADLRHRIRLLRDDFGITVLLNSHLLAEIEQLCDRVAILKAGRKVYEGRCDSLNREPVYQLVADPWETAAHVLGEQGATIVEHGQFRLPPGHDPAWVVDALVHAGVKVRELRAERASLEAFYLEISQS